ADLLPALWSGHGASLGAVAGSQARARRRDERRRLVAVPSRALRRIIHGRSHRTARWPVHDGRLVEGRAMDVLLVERRRSLPRMAPAISGRDARADHVWSDRAGGYRADTRWQAPHYQHGPPTGEHLVERPER